MHATLTPRTRRGMTLPEIMVALVLLGIITGGIMTVVMRQQQFYRSATDVIDTRQQIRQASAVVPVDLRGVSSIGGDIVSMNDKSLDVRANIGSGVACAIAGGNQILIPPTDLFGGKNFTTFLSRPRVNDVAMIFDDVTPGTQDDTWGVYTISAFDSVLVGCPSFTDAAKDVGKYRYRVTFSTPLSATIIAGAPVRFARRAKYEFYQSGTDRLWWLGYQDCRGDGSGCDALQPVSGPYRPYVAGDTTNSGVLFVYRDSTGVITNDRTLVARIDMYVHGETQGAVSLGGGKAAPYRDYMKVTIALRNRR